MAMMIVVQNKWEKSRIKKKKKKEKENEMKTKNLQNYQF